MDRNVFMDRIRQATAKGRAFQVELNLLATAEQSYVGGGADPVETLLKEWRAVGGFGARVDHPAAALNYLSEVIEKTSARSVLVWKHEVLEKLGLTDWLTARGIIVHSWADLEHQPSDERKAMAFGADLGITSVDWAVAETGSLVVCARPGGQGRSVSLLPAVHVALLTPRQIVPDLFDLLRALDDEHGAAGLPSNVTLITGPSKTGDIQLKLTTGVHGPGEVHMIILEE
jgi:L-lactate dehydrogenase complex protein LldG